MSLSQPIGFNLHVAAFSMILITKSPLRTGRAFTSGERWCRFVYDYLAQFKRENVHRFIIEVFLAPVSQVLADSCALWVASIARVA